MQQKLSIENVNASGGLQEVLNQLPRKIGKTTHLLCLALEALTETEEPIVVAASSLTQIEILKTKLLALIILQVLLLFLSCFAIYFALKSFEDL